MSRPASLRSQHRARSTWRQCPPENAEPNVGLYLPLAELSGTAGSSKPAALGPPSLVLEGPPAPETSRCQDRLAVRPGRRLHQPQLPGPISEQPALALIRAANEICENSSIFLNKSEASRGEMASRAGSGGAALNQKACLK